MFKWLNAFKNKKINKEVINVTVEEILKAVKSLPDEDKAKVKESLAIPKADNGEADDTKSTTIEKPDVKASENIAEHVNQEKEQGHETPEEKAAEETEETPVEQAAEEQELRKQASGGDNAIAMLSAKIDKLAADIAQIKQTPQQVTDTDTQSKLDKAMKIYN